MNGLQPTQDISQAIIHMSMDGILIFSPSDLLIASINPAAERIFGANSTEAVGRPLSHFLRLNKTSSESDADAALLALLREMRQANTRHELLGRRLEGTTFPLEFVVNEVSWQGEPHLLGIFRDISQRKTAESQHRESEMKYRRLVNTMQDGVFIIQKGKFQFVNDALARMLGYAADELVGADFLNIIAPEDREHIADMYWRSQAGEYTPTQFEFRLFHQDHETRILVVAKVRLTTFNGRPANMGMVTDITEQRAAQEALVESERKYRTLVNNMHDGVFIMKNGRITFVNEAMASMLGYTIEELTGFEYMQFLAPEEHERAATYYQNALAGQYAPTDFEMKLLHKDQTTRVMGEMKLELIQAEEGSYHIGTFSDLTERIKMENELKVTQFSVDRAVDTICWVRPDSYFVYANEAACKMFGYSLEEMLQMKVHDTHPNYDQVQYWEAHWEELRERGSWTFEVDNKRKNGEIFPAEITVNYISFGGQEFNCCSIRDITERRKAQTALQQSEQRNRLVVDTALDSVITIDTDGRITSWNAQAETTFGWEAAEVLGKSLGDTIVPQQHRKAHRRGIRRYLNTGKSRILGERLEITALRRDGEEFPIELSISPAILGKTTYFSAFIRDITAQKQAEAERELAQTQLQEAKEAAEAANRAKSAFLANMSHELRTPLNAIIGYSEMLEEDALDFGYDDFVPDLHKIHGAGNHLLALINDILDLSKIEAGKMDVYIESFVLADLLDSVVATIQPMMAKNENELEVDYNHLGIMYADKTKVRQILFNLLSNAAKFTEGGQIRLKVKRERPSVTTDSKTDWIKFEVIDSGIGMTDEQMMNLFRPFSQADSSTTRKFGGTGLGLAISRHFCRMMGGDITATSQYGQGSTFTALLPVDAEQSAKRVKKYDPDLIENLPEAEGRSDAKTILVIDDDPVARELIRRHLEKEGFRVEVAASGQEGLNIAHNIRPDAITLDVLMPGMDGWTVLSALKADDALTDIPVVMVTMIEDKNKGFTLGATEYLLKPIDRRRLVSVLNRYLPDGATPADNGSYEVMVVEDDSDTREMLRRTLEKEGWEVMTAENGRVALDIMTQYKPDLILLDLMMPEMDGFQFVSEVQQHPEWEDILIIVVTAKDLEPADIERLNGHVERVLQKGTTEKDGNLLRQICSLVKACIRQQELS